MEGAMAEAEVRERLRRLRASSPVEMRPGSAYEAVTRQMVEGLADQLKEIRGRLNGLLWMVAGAILLDVMMRLAGVGS
ncbi:MAG: hypothetical protein QOF33_2189 [Thermomicrobiales bacterium]|jgi:hypothetical protein|nr:hypothetical protein [Thermomicrobiales bacterium]MEA2598503.1 hypothetical protein [Thermomicrobiales bacterium]